MPPAFTVLLTEVFYRRNTYELIHQRTVRHSLCKSFSECFHSPGTIKKKRNTPNKFHHAFLYLGIKNTSWKHFSQVVLPQLESFIFSVLPITNIHLSESETVDQWCSINRNFPKFPTVSGAFYTRMSRSNLTSGFVSIRFLIFLGSDKTIKFLNISDSGNINKSQILRMYQWCMLITGMFLCLRSKKNKQENGTSLLTHRLF